MTDFIPMIVAFGAGIEWGESRVVMRSVTPPRRRTVLTHWNELAYTEDMKRIRGTPRVETAVLDIPLWVAESLHNVRHSSYVYTHVLLFRTDPRLAPPDSTMLCWSAGHVLGHGLGRSGTCLGHVQQLVTEDASFWNTSFNRGVIESVRHHPDDFWCAERAGGTAVVRPAEWGGT